MKILKKSLLLAIPIILIISASIFHHSNDKATITHHLIKPTYIDDLQWHRMVMRGGQFDPEKMVNGRQAAQKRFEKLIRKSSYKDAGLRAWNEDGPFRIGGRIRAIAVTNGPGKEETIYIGAAGGGIWRSTNSGTSWSALSDFNPSLAVTSIVIDPSNSNILYASTGEGQVTTTIGIPGAGIFKSTDGGDTWTQLSSTNNNKFYWVNKLAINPNDGNHILAVTSNVNKDGSVFGSGFDGGGELYESTNGGATWTAILGDDFLTDVEFHQTISTRRVIAGHGTLKVYNTTTGLYEEKVTGNTNEIPLWPGRIEVAISPLNAAYVIYALINAEDESGTSLIYRSTDGGTTWEMRGFRDDIFTSRSFGNYSNTIIVDPANNLNGIFLGGLDLWKSTDGGVTFSKISDWKRYHDFLNIDVYEESQLHADQHILVPSPNYSFTNRKMYIGNDGGIQKADDISTANDGSLSILSGWDNLLGDGLGITQFYGGDISPHNFTLGGGTQDNGIVIERSNQWRQPATGDGTSMVFHPNDENIVYANNNHQNVKKSTDGGATFSDEVSLGKNLAPLIAPFAINKQNTDILYLAGFGLWRYSDSNDQLVQIKDTLQHNFVLPYVTALAVDDSFRSIWVGYSNGVVEYSTNGGTTWSGDITSVGPPNTAVTDIQVYPFGPNGLDAFVTFGGYNQQNIWHHTHNGASSTWSNRSLDFDMQVNTVTRHPNVKEWVYVGTDVGVFASEDNGFTWSVNPIHSFGSQPNQANEGPVFTEVTDLFWKYESFGQAYFLYAATFGRGIWHTEYVLEEAFVDKNTTSTFQWGTRPHPVKRFIEGVEVGQNRGTEVIILQTGDGVYEEIGTTPRVFDKRVLITNEMTAGQSAIIK